MARIEDEQTTTVLEREHDRAPARWGAALLAGVIALLLIGLALWLLSDDADTTAAVNRGDSAAQEDMPGGSADSGERSSTGQLVVVEQAGGESADTPDVITESREGDRGVLEINVEQTGDLQAYDGATIRVPTGTELEVSFSNESDSSYSVHLLAGDEPDAEEIATFDPFVEAGEQREETFTTPPVPATFTVQVEREGDQVMEATLEVGTQ